VNQNLTRIHLMQPRQASWVGLLLLLLLTACLGGGTEAAEDAVVPEAAALTTGSLVCSESCLSQGQCGTAADGRIVILAHSNGPATRDHNTVLNNDSTILIVGQEPRTIADITGATATLNFFAVQPAEGGPTSWVAGSCVNPQ
jgi:hypothetical protein